MTEPILPRPCDIPLFRNEWSVLLECAVPAHDRERIADLLRSADWARLLILAEAHGVSGHLAAGLRDLEKNLVPPEIRQSLVDRQRAQIFLSMRLTAELFRILDLFTTEGIDALVIKGPALAARAYADSATRSYGDLDLLVRQRDIRRATELMCAAGFAPAVPLTAIDAGKMRRELDWRPRHRFEEAIAATTRWYQENEKWWRAIKTGEYLKYYDTMYGKRA